MKKWAIVYNPTKDGTQAVADQFAEILKANGASADVTAGPIDSLEGYDMGASVGGDGTLLGLVEPALKAAVPLVGINMGKLGYLTSLSTQTLELDTKRILAGEFSPLERSVIEVSFPDGTKRKALNDLVIKSAEFRLAELSVRVDGELVTQYGCDGIIFATATGSTAYNLSAGGPILHQGARGIVMTPICAHTLTNRSVLFDPKSTLEVRSHEGSVHINVDGRTCAQGCDCMPLTLKSAATGLITLEDPNRGHFATLRQKLSWR